MTPMHRLPAIIAVLALIATQFVHAAVVDAEETHHGVTHGAVMHGMALDHHGTSGGDAEDGGDMGSLHEVFHCGGHFAAPPGQDFFGVPLAPADHPVGQSSLYVSLSTAPPVRPPLS